MNLAEWHWHKPVIFTYKGEKKGKIDLILQLKEYSTKINETK